MLEWLQIFAIPIAALAIVLRGTERRVVRRLRSSGATSEVNAVELPRVSWVGRWQLDRLMKSGALVEVGGGLYYFDAMGYSAFRGLRRKRAAIVLPIVLILVLSLWYFSL